MFRNKNFNPEADLCYGYEELNEDLGLQKIIDSMSDGDKVILKTAKAALFTPLDSLEAICYRQEQLHDVLTYPEMIRKLYRITQETFKQERDSWFWLHGNYLSGTFSSAVGLLNIYTEKLMELRKTADQYLPYVQSSGFKTFFKLLQQELDDRYFQDIRSCLKQLADRNGVLISAQLGTHLQGIRYVYRAKKVKAFRRRWIFAPSWTLAPRDDSGAKDISYRSDRAMNEPVNALAQSAEHLKSFFSLLQSETAFYVGCCNLADRLKAAGMSFCIPLVVDETATNYSFQNLYDTSLALIRNAPVTPNTLNMNGKNLCIITGANQGGKTTFLRSIGQAQLMAQCGMFTGASGFTAPVRNGIFTHFKREEDNSLKSGKLDEELERMNGIAGQLKRGSLVLFNESFSATNEREGSELSAQIVQALTEQQIAVVFVTHQYEFVRRLYENRMDRLIFLKAERQTDGRRTFRIVPGYPERSSYGKDIYDRIFGRQQNCSRAYETNHHAWLQEKIK
jgi:DNA mismatch repair ATPase MutS